MGNEIMPVTKIAVFRSKKYEKPFTIMNGGFPSWMRAGH